MFKTTLQSSRSHSLKKVYRWCHLLVIMNIAYHLHRGPHTVLSQLNCMLPIHTFWPSYKSHTPTYKSKINQQNCNTNIGFYIRLELNLGQCKEILLFFNYILETI